MDILEARFDWSYSDQAQYDVITKKGCHWSRSGIGAREVPATGPAAFSRLPQHQQPSTFGQNIQDILYFPQRFACHALLSRSMTVRAHLVSLYIEFAAVSIYCYAFYFFLAFQVLGFHYFDGNIIANGLGHSVWPIG